MLARLLKRDIPLSGVGANETTGITIYDWAKQFAPGNRVVYNGTYYQAYQAGNASVGGSAYGANPIVFALASIRILLFSEVRFQWQQLRNGAPGDLFGNNDLNILEEPWPGHTTRDLLAQAEFDVMAAGNSYWVKNGNELQRLDPKNVKLITSKATDLALSGYQIGERLEGYAYIPDGDAKQATIYDSSEVCHYKPLPSPDNPFLGMSWLTPCLPEVSTDDLINTHKQATLQNGASLSYVVSFDPTVSREQFEDFVNKFNEQKSGPSNAGTTLFLGGGADVKTVGQTFDNLALQATQGSTEVRIAAAAGVPPAIAGISEGLKGSSLNAGNYGEARRRLADGTMRPLWGAFASAMQSLLPVPGGARLWYDDRHVAFLREDLADQANIDSTNAKTILALIQAGYEPDAAVQVVLSGDFGRLLGQHTGLTSVQLQPPMTEPFITGPSAPDAQPEAAPQPVGAPA